MHDKPSMKTIAEADRILAGFLSLPGFPQETYVGSGMINWKKLPADNRDMESLFVLNRHMHWSVLIDAYLMTKDEKYAKRVYDELENWIDTCPCPALCTDYPEAKRLFDTYSEEALACWRILEAGIRMFRSWCRLPELFAAYGHVSPELEKKLYASLRCHGEALMRISPVLHPGADHNHYLMENIGLFMIGYSFPQLDIAPECIRIGADEIKRCILAQFSRFGGQIEGCPYYHNEILDLVIMVLERMGECRIWLEDAYAERIRHALRYSVYATRPTRRITTFGDSDACEISEYKDVYRLIQQENWEKLPRFFYEKELGQVFYRSSWSMDAAGLAAICKIPVQNEHSHMDACSFEFTSNGKTMLIDPGRYTYQEGEMRKAFKGARYHNTLLVNGRDPFAYLKTWEYGEQKSAWVEMADEKEIVMKQLSYWPVVHTRTLRPCFEKNIRYIVIIDEVENLKGEYLELVYHLDYRDYAEIDQGILCSDGDTHCVILRDGHSRWSVSEGFVSERMDEKRETIRYIGKSKGAYGTVVMKTAVFAGGRLTGPEALKDYYDIFHGL